MKLPTQLSSSSSTQPMCLSKVTLNSKAPDLPPLSKQTGETLATEDELCHMLASFLVDTEAEDFLQCLPAFVYLYRTWVLTRTHLGADLFRCQIFLLPAQHLKRVIYFHFLHFLTSHSNTAIQLQLISTLPKALLSESQMLSNQMAS